MRLLSLSNLGNVASYVHMTAFVRHCAVTYVKSDIHTVLFQVDGTCLDKNERYLSRLQYEYTS